MANASDDAFTLEPGFFVGAYRISEPLERIPFGEVYLAKSTSEHRVCVLTLLSGIAEKNREWAASELERVAAMEHGGLVRSSGLQTEGRLNFVVSDHIEGLGGGVRTLADELAAAGGKLKRARCRDLARLLAQALAYSHRFQGRGICHGALRPEAVVFSTRGHARIRNMGLAALTGVAASPEQDLRDFGALTHQMLTGRSIAPGQTPEGLPNAWSKIIAGCLAAGSPEGYTSAGEVVKDIEKVGEKVGGGGLKGMLVAAAALIVALLVVGGVLLKKRADTRREIAHQETMRLEQEAIDAQAAKFLEAANQALARKNYRLAKKAVAKVLGVAPEHAKAMQLESDIRMQEGLEKIGDLKDRADSVWGKIRDQVEIKQLMPRRDAIEKTMREARKAFSEMRFDEAVDKYGQVVKAGETLQKLVVDRKRALNLKEAVPGAQELAEAKDAGKVAKETWDRAQRLVRDGETAFGECAFAKAAKNWSKAAEVYLEAAARAAGRSLVGAAKASYDQTRERADAKLFDSLSEDHLRRLGKMLAEGEGMTKMEKWKRAANSYADAEEFLSSSLDSATAKARTEDEAESIIASVMGGGEKRPRRTGNLVANDDFEKGRGVQPGQWSKLDGLTGGWDRKGKKGHALWFDTGVLQVDKAKYMKEIARQDAVGDKNATLLQDVDPAKAKNFKRSKGGQYSTVGAHEGVWAFSWPVEVRAEDRYFVVEADVLGPAKSTSLFYPQVFVRGYQKFRPGKDEGTASWFHTPHAGGPAFSEQFGKGQRRARRGDYLMVYRHSLVCRNSAANIWEHYRMAFKVPTNPRYKPEMLLLKCYAMWPLGVYRFDNVRLYSVKKEDYEKIRKQGHSIKGFMPTE
ncbi:MAG: hypothetical protein KAI66_12470 [Lentisphaeria bacterium]|nr:hypothetical protein [Lentisphaeria bacterium]